jgi:hypothetical protein
MFQGDFNDARARAAARRDAVIARSLADLGGLNARQAALVNARWSHPDWTWAQVGRSLGMSKYSAAAAFRRMAMKAGLR